MTAWYGDAVRWLAASIVAVTLVTLGTGDARAGARVGLIDVPADLQHALRVALEPWAIEVSPLEGLAPVGGGGTAIRVAAEAARTARVDALLWVNGDELWLFDAASGELSVRQVPPERDEATLAALALSAKTMLRTTMLVPPSERFGAAPRARTARFRLHAQTVIRQLATDLTRVTEPRLGVALSWWPAALRDRAGVSIATSAGPGFAVEDALLLARYTDTTIATTVRGRARLAPHWRAEAGAGLAVHLTALDGYAPAHDAAIAVRRTNGAVELGAALALALGAHAELVLDLAGGVALRRQRYLLGGTPVLELPLIERRAGLELRVELW